jgi:hypothetical protein
MLFVGLKYLGVGYIKSWTYELSLLCKWVENIVIMTFMVIGKSWCILKYGSYSLTLCFPFWKNVMSVHNFLAIGTSCIVGNGKTINFWHDTWHNNCPLTLQFSLVFAKVKNDKVSLTQVWNAGNIKFHSGVFGNQWNSKKLE